MNPRRLLALLGPRSPSLTRLMHREFGMRGNASPTTPQDVAGALAWIKHPLAAQVYLLLWFPGFAERDALRVAAQVGALLWREWQGRAARGAWACLPAKWGADPAAGCAVVARAVLFEMRHRQDCPQCAGYGMVAVGDGVGRCEPCAGQGFVPYPKKLRAKLVQLRRSVYLHQVEGPYAWLLTVVRELERTAASAHYDALRDAPAKVESR
jgi:FAD/FMN-containing dehydrogenase